MVRRVVLFLMVFMGITRTKACFFKSEDRTNIIQIANVVRSTQDKLERLEFQDRSVSEQLKKGMINIDIKIIEMLDPLKGTVSRLDERLAAVETILRETNVREKMQLQRNEDIRLAILQIVNLVRSTEDKLEKHEFLDRPVGEQLKIGMINIDRKIKMLDPLKGTVSRLDERLAAVETILRETNEREKMQLPRTYEVVIDIQKNLPVLLDKMKNDIISKISAHELPAQITEPLISKKDLEKLEKELINKIDKVSSSIGKIETELPKLKEDSKNIKDIQNQSSDNLEKLKKHINENQQLLTKYDNKLSEYNNKILSIPSDKEQSAWKQTILKALDAQKATTMDILQDIKNLQNQIKQLPQKDDVTKSHSSIIDKLTNGTNCLVPSLERDLNKVLVTVSRSHDDTIRDIKGLTEVTATLMKSFANTNNAIDLQKTDIKDISRNLTGLSKEMNLVAQKHDIEAHRQIIFKKIEEICSSKSTAEDLQNVLTTVTNNINRNHEDTIKNLHNLTKNVPTENVLNCQKTGIEGIQQNIKKLQSQISELPEKLDIKQNTTLQELEKLSHKISGCQKQSIDNIENILEDMKPSINNVTSEIEGDIQKVWRQISIMFQQMSSNSEALKQLQNQTDEYENEFLGKTNNVKGKVTPIIGRIVEVDENMNFLLGRLSLETQEINRIKSGLTAALDQMKGSFKTVQNKLNEGLKCFTHDFENYEVPNAN